MIKYSIILLSSLWLPFANAYEISRAKENFADELIECAAYYCIIGSEYHERDHVI